MNYHDWIKGKGADVVKSAGDSTYFHKRPGDSTGLGFLRELFVGQKIAPPWCNRLGKSKDFTDVCSAIYNSLASSNRTLQGMGEIGQILIGAVLIAGRIPKKTESGLASIDKSHGQGFSSLPFKPLYKSAFEAGFKVGLLPKDVLDAMDANRGDNLEWRNWLENINLPTTGERNDGSSKEIIILTESNLPTSSYTEVIESDVVLAHDEINLLRADEAEGAESQDQVAYNPEDGDLRELVTRQIRARRGQQQFRDALREQYGNRCVVTNCGIVAILEAAHINPYRGDNDNHPTNGLLLRTDIHTLFDLNLLGVEPELLHVELHPDIIGEYGYLVDKPLICPIGIRPSRKALEARYKLFCQRRENAS